jgi:hypothetical protein
LLFFFHIRSSFFENTFSENTKKKKKTYPINNPCTARQLTTKKTSTATIMNQHKTFLVSNNSTLPACMQKWSSKISAPTINAHRICQIQY